MLVDESRSGRPIFVSLNASPRVGAFLEKPVSQFSLLNSMREAIGEMAMERPLLLIEPTSESLHILVVEDISANQKVVKVLLTKRGHHVTVAHNGREAVDLYQGGKFDVILMDVQMPVLDGLQATRAIRTIEKPSAEHTPIVAMTTHAMRRDRELCLSAGMDGFLSKPLDAQLLLGTVEQFGMSRRPSGTLESRVKKSASRRSRQAKMNSKESPEKDNPLPTDDSNSRDLWNPAVALRRMGDDTELLCSMVDYFLEDSPLLLLQLQGLIDAADADEASRVAHSLKGLCANFEAYAAVQAAGDTEIACRDGKFTDAAALLNSLNAELRDLLPSLTSWQRQNKA